MDWALVKFMNLPSLGHLIVRGALTAWRGEKGGLEVVHLGKVGAISPKSADKANQNAKCRIQFRVSI